MGVIKAISAGTGRDNLGYAVNSKEIFNRRFIALLNADAALISSVSFFISRTIAALLIFLSSVVFFYFKTEISCAID
jgi:hypothetical protein